MSFADSQFEKVLAFSPFSTHGVITLDDDSELTINGFFCSGNYGMKELDKGYTKPKTEKGQSFKTALAFIPEGTDVLRKKMVVDGKYFIIDEIVGNQSGILNLVLKPGKTPVVPPEPTPEDPTDPEEMESENG